MYDEVQNLLDEYKSLLENEESEKDEEFILRIHEILDGRKKRDTGKEVVAENIESLKRKITVKNLENAYNEFLSVSSDNDNETSKTAFDVILDEGMGKTPEEIKGLTGKVENLTKYALIPEIRNLMSQLESLDPQYKIETEFDGVLDPDVITKGEAISKGNTDGLSLAETKEVQEALNNILSGEYVKALIKNLNEKLAMYKDSTPNNKNEMSEKASDMVTKNGEGYSVGEIRESLMMLEKAMKYKKNLISELDRILNDYYLSGPDNINELTEKAYDMVATGGKAYTLEDIRKTSENLINAMNDREQLVKELGRVKGEYENSEPDNVTDMTKKAAEII